ncbi:hypothetical protein TCSYLVIO_004835 [Trypanosoma cruzi]|nr:hypothetical protein TCSYLVIO_004835 [Trypanosoma cruzi]
MMTEFLETSFYLFLLFFLFGWSIFHVNALAEDGDMLVHSRNATVGEFPSGVSLCPRTAPIYCAFPGMLGYYCVRAGEKCCNAFEGGGIGCQQGEMCCPGVYKASCCGFSETCDIDASNRSLCVKDRCAVHSDVDSCLIDQGETECRWCCAERRCVSSVHQCINEKPITRGEMCYSPCQYADTCRRCLRGAISDNSHSVSCVWCCSTQSCIPRSEISNCAQDQFFLKLVDCDECLEGGRGVLFWLQYAAISSLPSAVIVLLVGAATIGLALPYAMRCSILRRQQPVVDDARIHAPETRGSSVRRHGFNNCDGAVRRWWMRSRSAKNTLSHDELGYNRVISCSSCHCILHVQRLIKEILGGVSKLPRERQESNMNRVLPSAVDAMSIPQRDVFLGNGGDNNNKDDDDDDAVVILLPCNHLFCYPCMGLDSSRRVRGSCSKDLIFQSGGKAGVEAKCRDISSEFLEKDKSQSQGQLKETKMTEEMIVMAHCRGVCPRCGRGVKDNILIEHIVRL